MTEDMNDLAFWLPRIQAAGLPTPRTTIIKSPDMTGLLDGEEVEGWRELYDAIKAAGDCAGWPCFLRTGHGSGKHQWADTCYLESVESIGSHVAALVEWSHMADMMGLPTTTWAVRELVETEPLLWTRRYGMMPVVSEFRFFVRDGEVEHLQGYWPLDAVHEGDPVDEMARPIARGTWATLIENSRALGADEMDMLTGWAVRAAGACGGGHWSVDFMETASGHFLLIDMALGDQSYRYDSDPPIRIVE